MNDFLGVSEVGLFRRGLVMSRWGSIMLDSHWGWLPWGVVGVEEGALKMLLLRPWEGGI